MVGQVLSLVSLEACGEHVHAMDLPAVSKVRPRCAYVIMPVWVSNHAYKVARHGAGGNVHSARIQKHLVRSLVLASNVSAATVQRVGKSVVQIKNGSHAIVDKAVQRAISGRTTVIVRVVFEGITNVQKVRRDNCTMCVNARALHKKRVSVLAQIIKKANVRAKATTNGVHVRVQPVKRMQSVRLLHLPWCATPKQNNV